MHWSMCSSSYPFRLHFSLFLFFVLKCQLIWSAVWLHRWYNILLLQSTLWISWIPQFMHQTVLRTYGKEYEKCSKRCMFILLFVVLWLCIHTIHAVDALQTIISIKIKLVKRKFYVLTQTSRFFFASILKMYLYHNNLKTKKKTIQIYHWSRIP